MYYFSTDDVAFNKNEDVKTVNLRARQNVIFRIRIFSRKNRWENVFVLHEQTENFEISTDYQGVVFEVYDANDNWKLSLAKEIKIDRNKLLEQKTLYNN